jgi:hypothetical protein
MNEAIAYNYFTVIEEGKNQGKPFAECLDSSLWVKYIHLHNELTDNFIPPRKCLRRTMNAHAHLSDYFKLKQ